MKKGKTGNKRKYSAVAMPPKCPGYVLIVESEGIIGMDMKVLLETGGYKTSVTSCRNCDIGTDGAPLPELIVAEKKFYCGSSSCKSLESVLINKKIPVVFIISHAVAGTIDTCGLNVVGIFHKPFNSQEIVNAIDIYFKDQRKISLQ